MMQGSEERRRVVNTVPCRDVPSLTYSKVGSCTLGARTSIENKEAKRTKYIESMLDFNAVE